MAATDDLVEDKFQDSRYSTNEDEDAAAAEQRFQAQCYLITRMVKGDPRFINSRTKGGKKYTKFTVINANKGGAAEVVNKLTSIGKAQSLFDMTSEEMAVLVPEIRLFKVFEAPGNKNPLEREFKFSEGSFYSSNTSDGSTILQSRGGRGSDIGIESVEFELLATQPAEVTNNIKCKIKLFFKNLDVLEKPLGEVIDKVPSIKPADLILRPKMGNRANSYQPEYYRVKLSVGWAIPPGFKMRNELKDALQRGRKILNLTLKSHEFDFNMDGTSSLTIDYQAWVEGALSSQNTDLFQPSSDDRIALDELTEELEREKKAHAKEDGFGKQPGAAGAKKTPGSKGKAPKAPNVKTKITADSNPPDAMDANNRLEEIEATIKEIENRTASKRYREFLNMITRKGGPAEIWDVEVDPSQVGKETEGGKGDGNGKQKSVKRSVMAKERCAKEDSGGPAVWKDDDPPGKAWSKGGPGSWEAKGGAASAGGMGKVNKAINQAYDGNALPDQAAKDELKKAIAGLAVGPGGSYRINYMFFGDLLEVAYSMLEKHTAYSLSPTARITLLTGPCFIANPCDPGRYITMNIADIPVSTDLFLNWFKTNILDKDIKKYLLRNFINDLLGKLISPALGANCFSEVRQTLRVHGDILNLRGFGTGGSKAPFKRGLVLPVSAVDKIVSRIDYSGGVTHKTHDYLLLYSYGLSPRYLRANRHADALLGIYHFDLGRDVGILKDISFSKNDSPYLGEAKVIGKGDIGADLAGGAIYNAELELYGNGLFVPGQYIFINPRSLGLGRTNNPKSIANRLRLGGYYMITKVSSELSSGDFSTKISGVWETPGKLDPEPSAPAGDGDGDGPKSKDWKGKSFFDDSKTFGDDPSNEPVEKNPDSGNTPD